MPRPYPEPNAINSTVDVLKYSNDVTGGWLMVLFVMIMPLIMFLIFKQRGEKTGNALLVSLTLSTVLNSFLWLANLIQGRIIVITLLLTIASGIYSVFEK